MVRRRLPIGIQTYATMREQDCYDVDKTAYIERLIERFPSIRLAAEPRHREAVVLRGVEELWIEVERAG